MLIERESIVRYFEKFGHFAVSLGMPYVAWLDAVYFRFKPNLDEDPTSHDLQKLFFREGASPCDDECKKNGHRKNGSPNCIEGILHHASFAEIRTYIDRCIISGDFETAPENNYPDFWGLSLVSPEIAKERLDTYWGMVEQIFPLPPTRAYWFENTTGDYLGQQVFWGFTVVLLNDKTGKGIVLDGGTSD